jgi:hypothetical protein
MDRYKIDAIIIFASSQHVLDSYGPTGLEESDKGYHKALGEDAQQAKNETRQKRNRQRDQDKHWAFKHLFGIHIFYRVFKL